MPLDLAAGLLACPVCAALLDVTGQVVSCRNGHRYDVARQGYVNLLGAAPPANADTPAMVAARDRFLASGAYDGIAAAVVESLREVQPSPAVLYEVGAGTGWYLARALDRLPDARGVALDVSVAAARKAARSHPRTAAVVADTWRKLPLVTDRADALLCVFAPRNVTESRRVLRPGGLLVVVHPNPGHLSRLRRAYGLLDLDPDKKERLAAQLAGWRVERRRVACEVDATAGQVGDLVAMGPNAFHTHGGSFEPARLEVDVTVISAVAL